MIIDTPKLSDIPALRVLWQESFGDSDEFLDLFFSTAFDTARSRCITVDRTIIAALYWLDCSFEEKRIAYIYAVATAKAYRGRGVCSALMEDTHRHAASLGYKGVILVPGSSELFRFYKKLGYTTCCYVSEFNCAASDVKAELRKLDAEEYARLRRVFLPKNGVVQENENIKFLQTQAAFYAGDGFLLAARCEKDTLYGVELLGDTEAAPFIVRTLGCAKGCFRAPGTDKPFAMYHALSEGSLSPPAYFGWAFD